MSTKTRCQILLLLLIGIYSVSAKAQEPSANIKIRVHIDNLKPADSLTLIFRARFLTDGLNIFVPADTISAPINKDGWCILMIPRTAQPGYISLLKGLSVGQYYGNGLAIFSEYLCEPSDNIDIVIDSIYLNERKNGWLTHKMTFSGNGAAKYEYLDQIFREEKYWLKNADWFKTMKYLPVEARRIVRSIEVNDTVLLMKNEILKGCEPKMSSLAYQILKADNEGDYLKRTYSLLIGSSCLMSDSIKALILPYQRIFINRKLPRADQNAAYLSKNYAEGIVKRESALNIMTTDSLDVCSSLKKNNLKAYQILRNNFKGKLRDKLVTVYLLLRKININEELEEQMKDAVTFIDDPIYKEQVDAILNNTSKGVPAKDFTLPNSDGNLIHLTDFKNKVVFIDFWYTGCTNCAAFYKGHLSKVEEYYKDNPAVVFISISIDGLKEKWLKSIESGKYTSSSAINLYTNGKSDKHKVIQDYKVGGYPRPILIDKHGKIFSADNASLRNKDSLLRMIELALNS